ncbi:MAG: GIY-YIG nuclease family protein [Pseudomonadota bacterium]
MEDSIFTTYAIVDPKTRLFIYVGQSVDFERRKAEHLKRSRTRKTKHPKGTIKAWLAEAERAGITPQFVILDVVETEEQSLLSESNWVEKLAAIGHPILNRWEEHQELIEAGRAGPEFAEYTAFWPGRWSRIVATMKPTQKGNGFFSLVFPEETTIKEGGRLVIMPTKATGPDSRG